MKLGQKEFTTDEYIKHLEDYIDDLRVERNTAQEECETYKNKFEWTSAYCKKLEERLGKSKP